MQCLIIVCPRMKCSLSCLSRSCGFSLIETLKVTAVIIRVDGVQAESARPQPSGTGRLLMAGVTSGGGTTGYEKSRPASSVTGPSHLAALTRMLRFGSVHLADTPGSTASGMETVQPAFRVGGVTVPATFGWPPGASQKVRAFSRITPFGPRSAQKLRLPVKGHVAVQARARKTRGMARKPAPRFR